MTIATEKGGARPFCKTCEDCGGRGQVRTVRQTILDRLEVYKRVQSVKVEGKSLNKFAAYARGKRASKNSRSGV